MNKRNCENCEVNKDKRKNKNACIIARFIKREGWNLKDFNCRWYEEARDDRA